MHRQFGLVQDVLVSPISYQNEGTIPIDDVQLLVYVELDPSQEEDLIKDDIREDDVGVIEAFSA